MPPEIRPLIDRCLAKDPGQRPATGDLLAELGATNAPGGLPGHMAGRPPEPGQAGKAARPGGSGPGATAVSEPVKSPADIARELRAAAPPGTKPDRAEHLAPPRLDQAEPQQPTRAERARAEARALRARRAEREQQRRDEEQREAQAADASRKERGLRLVLSDSERANAEAYELYRYVYKVRTVPEFARCLRTVAAGAGDSGTDRATTHARIRSAGPMSGDIDAVRAGRLIPSRELLDEFLASCGVNAEHLKPWHAALARVGTSTAGVINLRTRALELAAALDRELKASGRLWPPSKLIRNRDPSGRGRASTYGHLYGQMQSLAGKMPHPGRRGYDPAADPGVMAILTGHGEEGDPVLPPAPWSLIEALDEYSDSYDEPHWLRAGVEGVKDTVAALAAVQVDASGVDLRNLSIPERNAVLGVIWTPYTKWPDSIVGAIRPPRSRTIRDDVFQVT